MTNWYLSDGTVDLEVAVADDVDMDGTFEAVCLHTGETLYVNGWQILDMERIEG